MITSRGPIIGPLKLIKLKDHIVRYVSESECLGMTVDNRLRWNSHIKRHHPSKKVRQLKRMKSLPADILETICLRGMLPSATYGIGIWGSCIPSLLEELGKVHRRAARIIHKIPKRIPRGLILDEAKWKPINYHYKKRIACLTHQAYYRKHPDVINDLVVKHSLNRMLRDNLRIEVPQSKTNVGRCNFRQSSSYTELTP